VSSASAARPPLPQALRFPIDCSFHRQHERFSGGSGGSPRRRLAAPDLRNTKKSLSHFLTTSFTTLFLLNNPLANTPQSHHAPLSSLDSTAPTNSPPNNGLNWSEFY